MRAALTAAEAVSIWTVSNDEGYGSGKRFYPSKAELDLRLQTEEFQAPKDRSTCVMRAVVSSQPHDVESFPKKKHQHLSRMLICCSVQVYSLLISARKWFGASRVRVHARRPPKPRSCLCTLSIIQSSMVLTRAVLRWSKMADVLVLDSRNPPSQHAPKKDPRL